MANNHWEWGLQTLITKWVRQHVAQPHYFFACDRSAQTKETYTFERHRGIRAGQPDTCLIVPHGPAIFVELKAPGKGVSSLSEAQKWRRDEIRSAGHSWEFANSVQSYAKVLQDFGVDLHGNWELAAENSDAVLRGKMEAAALEKMPTEAIKRKYTRRAGEPRYSWKATP